ncbi:hypothetical protein CHS0354_015824 [Potamilus streckersoni]|uniref:G-protein coupled receptors family 1 profile domain-containing protein n=1 Tax=Potamilus streckersoni TaxID=2493646 RepID=A0AAE0SDS3_9BIVA|nr:hypothetical protein CHS0354_015824 [Potamilus streckersoni]
MYLNGSESLSVPDTPKCEHVNSNSSESFVYLSVEEKVLLTCFMSAVILFTTIGNLVTLVAVLSGKYLKSMSHWFIASLATADLIVGCFVMPFSMLYNVTFDGEWYFGQFMCDVWQFVDYVAITASLANVCTIAMDRYWTVSRPLRTIHTRTKGRVIWMLLITWLIPVVHWAMFLLILKFQDKDNYSTKECTLNWRPSYMSHVKRLSVHLRSSSKTDILSDIDTQTYDSNENAKLSSGVPVSSVDTIEDSEMLTSTANADVEFASHATICCCLNIFGGQGMSSECSSGSSPPYVSDPGSDVEMSVFVYGSADSKSFVKVRKPFSTIRRNKCLAFRIKKETSYQVEKTSVKSPNRQSSRYSCKLMGTTEKKSLVKSNEFTDCERSLKSASSREGKRFSWRKFADDMNRKRQTNLEKYRLAQQIRAAKTLSAIMIFLLLCWLPFSIMWPVKTFCPSCISHRLFTFSFWVNYINSTLNPIIYCLTNPTFRRAYRKMLLGHNSIKRRTLTQSRRLADRC